MFSARLELCTIAITWYFISLSTFPVSTLIPPPTYLASMSANRLWCCSITYTNGIAKRIAAGGVLTQRLKETCVHDWSAFGCQPPRPDELYTLSNGDICFNASCGLGDAVRLKHLYDLM